MASPDRTLQTNLPSFQSPCPKRGRKPSKIAGPSQNWEPLHAARVLLASHETEPKRVDREKQTRTPRQIPLQKMADPDKAWSKAVEHSGNGLVLGCPFSCEAIGSLGHPRRPSSAGHRPRAASTRPPGSRTAPAAGLGPPRGAPPGLWCERLDGEVVGLFTPATHTQSFTCDMQPLYAMGMVQFPAQDRVVDKDGQGWMGVTGGG